MDFYNDRDVAPDRVYPPARRRDGCAVRRCSGGISGNVDVDDPPFDRHPGDAPAMTEMEEQDIIAFLGTLSDGYRPSGR
jgi:cytochrome c peroxidase